MSPDSLCRWQVQVSVYCVWWIPAHLKCTQCSILLQLMDISFLQCICLWHISQIQTCLCVGVGPGFVSTSPAFMRSSASHPAGQHDRLAKNGKSGPIVVTAPLLVVSQENPIILRDLTQECRKSFDWH